MRVVIESKHTLVVETPGSIMPALAFIVLAAHLTIFVPQVQKAFELGNQGVAMMVIILSLAIYGVLFYLCFGPSRDRTVITLQAEKSRVLIERKLPLGLSSDTEVAFSDFECFEISPPSAGGFCRLRMKDGSTRKLLRVRTDEDFALMQRLPLITRKDVATVRENGDSKTA